MRPQKSVIYLKYEPVYPYENFTCHFTRAKQMELEYLHK